jgi:hypothetical protein
LVAQTVETVETISAENRKLYSEAERAYRNGESLKQIIQHIALNLEKIHEMRNQKEFIPSICNIIIRDFKDRGLERLESSVYKSLSEKQFTRFKTQQFSRRSLESSTDIPEDILIEKKELTNAIALLKKAKWERYDDEFVMNSQIAINDSKEKIERYEDENDILRSNKAYNVLDALAKSSQYAATRPLVEPPRDESLNCVRMQYEFLLMDIRNFINNFVKRYYPPEDQQKYYARAIFLFRKWWTQYESNKIHRDFLSWSEIYEADEGRLKSGKSAKEISARYGGKIRRYDKQTGEPIFGRKSICKEQIEKKKESLASFMRQVYQYIPLLFYVHNQYAEGKEKIFVDHAIDVKPKRQHFS